MPLSTQKKHELNLCEIVTRHHAAVECRVIGRPLDEAELGRPRVDGGRDLRGVADRQRDRDARMGSRGR